MAFEGLPTLADIARARAFKPIPKGQSRLQKQVAEKKLAVVDEKAFRAAIFARDKGRCRKCGLLVTKTITRCPGRAEVHHIHGRAGDLRFDDRAALLMCAKDHELVTGKVSERWAIVPTKTFTMRQGTFTDARFPVKFEKVA